MAKLPVAAGDQQGPQNFCENYLGITTTKYPQFPLGEMEPITYYASAVFRGAMSMASDEKAERIVNEAISKMVARLKSDPNLSGFKDADFELAAKEALKWAPYTASTVGFLPPTANTTAAYYLEKYRLYLRRMGIDPDSKPKSFSDMIRQFGYDSLAHGTTIDGLLKIVLDGQVKPASVSQAQQNYEGVSNPEYLYLEALPKRLETYFFKKYPVNDPINWWKSNDEKMHVYLEIDSSILDDLPWTFNIYWNYGKSSREFTIEPSEMLAAFFNLIKTVPVLPPTARQRELDYGVDLYDAGYPSTSEVPARNEFLLRHSFDFWKYVKSISINPSFETETIARLKSSGASPKVLPLIRMGNGCGRHADSCPSNNGSSVLK